MKDKQAEETISEEKSKTKDKVTESGLGKQHEPAEVQEVKKNAPGVHAKDIGKSAGEAARPATDVARNEKKWDLQVNAECSSCPQVTIAVKKKAACEEPRGSGVLSYSPKVDDPTRDREQEMMSSERTRSSEHNAEYDVTGEYKSVGNK